MEIQFDPHNPRDRASVQYLIEGLEMRAHIDAQMDEQREELLKAKLSEPHPEEGVITESEYGDRQRADRIRSVEREAETKATPGKTDLWDQMFAQFWAAVPHKIKRGRAQTAFKAAVVRVANTGEMSKPDAAKFITDRMEAYAKTPAGNPTDRSPTHPSSWLAAAQYEDDPQTWDQENGVQTQRKLKL
jgi:hypothetical protein